MVVAAAAVLQEETAECRSTSCWKRSRALIHEIGQMAKSYELVLGDLADIWNLETVGYLLLSTQTLYMNNFMRLILMKFTRSKVTAEMLLFRLNQMHHSVEQF